MESLNFSKEVNPSLVEVTNKWTDTLSSIGAEKIRGVSEEEAKEETKKVMVAYSALMTIAMGVQMGTLKESDIDLKQSVLDDSLSGLVGTEPGMFSIHELFGSQDK